MRSYWKPKLIILPGLLACVAVTLPVLSLARQSDHRDVDPVVSHNLSILDSRNSQLDRIVAINKLGTFWRRESRVVSEQLSELASSVERKLGLKIVEDQQSGPKEQANVDEVKLIANSIKKLLLDRDERIRESAAHALSNAPMDIAEVRSAAEIAINSKDVLVLTACQGDFIRFQPPIEKVIDCLLETLESDDFGVVMSGANILSDYGQVARPFSDRLAALLKKSKVRNQHMAIISILISTGVSESAAKQLLDYSLNKDDDVKAPVFVVIFQHLRLAKSLADSFSDFGNTMLHREARLFDVLNESPQFRAEFIKTFHDSKNLPPGMLALIGDENRLPEIEARIKTSEPPDQFAWLAAARACGRLPDQVITVSLSHPLDFRPTSALTEEPDDPNRLVGVRSALITGVIQLQDGRHPESIRFLLNGDSNNDDEMGPAESNVIYESKTGEFLYYADLSLYSSSKVGSESLMTGHDDVTIVAPNCIPLPIKFFDEMPHLAIELETTRN